MSLGSLLNGWTPRYDENLPTYIVLDTTLPYLAALVERLFLRCANHTQKVMIYLDTTRGCASVSRFNFSTRESDGVFRSQVDAIIHRYLGRSDNVAVDSIQGDELDLRRLSSAGNVVTVVPARFFLANEVLQLEYGCDLNIRIGKKKEGNLLLQLIDGRDEHDAIKESVQGLRDVRYKVDNLQDSLFFVQEVFMVINLYLSGGVLRKRFAEFNPLTQEIKRY